METKNELVLQLTSVNDAIARIIAGEHITELIIGSGLFTRKYKYTEISLSMLKEERIRITTKLAVIDGTAQTFRASSVVQTTYSKF